MKPIFIIISISILLVLSLCGKLFSITYLHILVEGEEVDTIYQGETYYFEFDCIPLDTLYLMLVPDKNENGILDPGEECILDSLVLLEDNRVPGEYERGPLYDSDPTEGLVEVKLRFYAKTGGWFFGFRENGDSAYKNITFAALYPATMSLSGTVTLEGLEVPDHRLENLLFFALSLSPDSLGAFFACDSMGDFHFDWFGTPGNVMFNFINDVYYDALPEYSFAGYDSIIYIDSHIYDYEIYVPYYVPDTARIYGYIGSSMGGGITSESLLVLYYRESYGLDTLFDTLYIDVNDGVFDIKIPFRIMGYPMLHARLTYHDIPEGFMYPLAYLYPELTIINLISDTDTLEYYFSDTLYHENDTLWLNYTYDPFATPYYINLPVTVYSNYGVTTALVRCGTPTPVLVYGTEDEYGFNHYNVSMNCDTCLPPRYGFHYGEFLSVQVQDTLVIVLGEKNTTVAGTLYSSMGDRIDAEVELVITEYESDTRTDWGWESWYSLEDGTFLKLLFDNTLYSFKTANRIDGFMEMHPIYRTFSSGIHPLRMEFYPLDSSYWLYIEIESGDPRDDTLLVKLTSPAGDAVHAQKCRTNRWTRMNIYSGFVEPCLLEISNWLFMETYPPFTRLIENNGSIPVLQGDSLRITAVMPVDYCIADVTEDTADSWQHPLSPYSLVFDYYTRAETTLVYTYIPVEGYSLQLPVFLEQMVVRPRAKDWVWALHYFVANPDGFILGGAYRPEHIPVYLNKGSGEMLVQFNGHDPYYLGADTIFLEYGTLSGVETPEYPDHHYVTDFFLFKMVPTYHPYGYGTVMAFHDICDGEWTINFPDTLPGGFIPAVSETSFYCEDISFYPDEWQEFEIEIPVISPPGVHGYIHRESRFLQANMFQIDYISTDTDTLIASRNSWQYYAWGPENIYVKYFIAEDDLPPGNYYTRIQYTGYHDREPFQYPEKIEFTYTGDSLLLPDCYMARTKGYAHITVTDLPTELYSSSLIRMYMPEEYITTDIEFYNMVAEYPFPDPDSTLILKVPAGNWLIEPYIPYGVTPKPEDTLLNIPYDPVDSYYVNFNFSDISNEGLLYGYVVTENEDPSPLAPDSFIVSILSLDGTSIIRESLTDEFGYYEFRDLYTPSILSLIFSYTHDTGIFYEMNNLAINLDEAETLNLGEIYADNANATIIVEFEGVDEERLGLIEHLNFFPVEHLYMDDTINFDYNSGFEIDTFIVCDGSWNIKPPGLPGITLEPPETTIVIDESFSSYYVLFTNPENIGNKPPIPCSFDLRMSPNPFNKNVTLTYTLPKTEHVTLEVYNIQGQHVATLIDGLYTKGIHQVKWNFETKDEIHLSSGLYFFKLHANEDNKIIKGVLIK
ncbi:T9SS type A sorting domain-containing protein [bacterium]|nr:T9SS type A sorting domain-containing protein [bacterium]